MIHARYLPSGPFGIPRVVVAPHPNRRYIFASLLFRGTVAKDGTFWHEDRQYRITGWVGPRQSLYQSVPEELRRRGAIVEAEPVSQSSAPR